jgi:transcriptional regulator with XRE-family HTH domain
VLCANLTGLGASPHHVREMSETIGQRIIRLRKAKGWSRTDLFERSNYRTYNNLLNVELHGVRPNSDQLEKLAEVLGTTSSYLLRGDEGPQISGIDEDTWVSMLPASDAAAETLAHKAWELAEAAARKPQRPSLVPSLERSSTDRMAPPLESTIHPTGEKAPRRPSKPNGKRKK